MNEAYLDIFVVVFRECVFYKKKEEKKQVLLDGCEAVVWWLIPVGTVV